MCPANHYLSVQADGLGHVCLGPLWCSLLPLCPLLTTAACGRIPRLGRWAGSLADAIPEIKAGVAPAVACGLPRLALRARGSAGRYGGHPLLPRGAFCVRVRRVAVELYASLLGTSVSMPCLHSTGSTKPLVLLQVCA